MSLLLASFAIILASAAQEPVKVQKQDPVKVAPTAKVAPAEKAPTPKECKSVSAASVTATPGARHTNLKRQLMKPKTEVKTVAPIEHTKK